MTYQNCNDCVRLAVVGVTSCDAENRIKRICISGKLYYYRNTYTDENGELYYINLLKKCCYIKYFIGVRSNSNELEHALLRNLNTNIIYNKQLNDYLYEFEFSDTDTIINPFQVVNSNSIYIYDEIDVNRDIKYVLINDSFNMCNIQ